MAHFSQEFVEERSSHVELDAAKTTLSSLELGIGTANAHVSLEEKRLYWILHCVSEPNHLD